MLREVVVSVSRVTGAQARQQRGQRGERERERERVRGADAADGELRRGDAAAAAATSEADTWQELIARRARIVRARRVSTTTTELCPMRINSTTRRR